MEMFKYGDNVKFMFDGVELIGTVAGEQQKMVRVKWIDGKVTCTCWKAKNEVELIERAK